MAKKKGKSKAAKAKVAAQPAAAVAEPAAGALTVNQPMKMCRLCESKDGPFLNIFDGDKVIAKKIEDMMPFGIAENDELPHKICFRCSAKVEELNEFVQKCIKTQQNLRISLGRTSPLLTKTKKQRFLWEEKLSISNISNDDICDAVIKKAMEGIKDPFDVVSEQCEPIGDIQSLNTSLIESKKKTVENVKTLCNESSEKSPAVSPVNKTKVEAVDKSGVEDSKCKPVKSTVDKHNQPNRRSTRANPIESGQSKSTVDNLETNVQDTPVATPNEKSENISNVDKNESCKSDKNVVESNPGEETAKIPEKLFNVMDYVSTIKVNGVGILFQCRLCNRNFLKRSVVKTHGCARTGVPKEDLVKPSTLPEPRKTPVIKYINTKSESEAKPTTVSRDVRYGTKQNLESIQALSAEIKNADGRNTIKPKPRIGPASKVSKPKPKIGPASKVKHEPYYANPTIGMVVKPMERSPTTSQDSSFVSVQLPTVPSMNCPYKLIPGPNNTFTLVEEQGQQKAGNFKTLKRPSDEPLQCVDDRPKPQKIFGGESCGVTIKKSSILKQPDSKIFGSDNQSITRQVAPVHPYPVGLFQTMPTANPPIFSTTALKKQSYTVVQTGNPSKLLISAKPQYSAQVMPTKRTATNVAPDRAPESVPPFSVSLQGAGPPKDDSFFTFVNVDPLLQPSYVLPTENIQEAQISTSTNTQAALEGKANEKSHYTCNMCSQTFTREKKLLAHIHSHYDKMDEEDQLRAEKYIEKHSRKHGSKSTTK